MEYHLYRIKQQGPNPSPTNTYVLDIQLIWGDPLLFMKHCGELRPLVDMVQFPQISSPPPAPGPSSTSQGSSEKATASGTTDTTDTSSKSQGNSNSSTTAHASSDVTMTESSQ